MEEYKKMKTWLEPKWFLSRHLGKIVHLMMKRWFLEALIVVRLVVTLLSTKLGEGIGAESTLPYLSPMLTGQKLLVGANFASAGVGVLNDTGVQFGNIIRMPIQMANLEQYKRRLQNLREQLAKMKEDQAERDKINLENQSELLRRQADSEMEQTQLKAQMAELFKRFGSSGN